MNRNDFDGYTTLNLLYLVDEAMGLEATGFQSKLGDFVIEAKDIALELLFDRGLLLGETECETFEERVAEAIGVEKQRLRVEALETEHNTLKGASKAVAVERLKAALV